MAYLIHQLLEDAARTAADREAVRCGQRSLTYGELETAASKVAAALLEAGVTRGDRVGIYLPKSVEMLCSVYGALKAGAAYVPLDIHAPTRRVATIVSDCETAALITSPGRGASLIDALEGPLPRLVILVQDAKDQPERVIHDVNCILYEDVMSGTGSRSRDVQAIDQDLAYVLYTSGSTGVPKGVMLSHRNALTFIEWCAAQIAVSPDDRFSNHAPLHFDLSVFDIFLAAYGRACVVLVPDEIAFFGTALAEFIRSEHITVWYSVPSALILLGKVLDEGVNLPSLRAVAFAGEVFPTKHLRELCRGIPHATFWNLFGPTETNVCTYFRVDHMPDTDHPIPIGRSCENTETLVLKGDGSMAGDGEEGELLVRGSTVMKGYWRRPEDTKRVLIADPTGTRPGEYFYRTGDTVRLRPDGDYEFLGRRDHQIKSRGFRIELGDIETVLNEHPSVVQGVAVAVAHRDWGSAVTAFVVPRDGVSITEKSVRLYVAERLPRYMVPTVIRIVDELPRTSTGKIDRQRLASTANVGRD